MGGEQPDLRAFVVAGGYGPKRPGHADCGAGDDLGVYLVGLGDAGEHIARPLHRKAGKVGDVHARRAGALEHEGSDAALLVDDHERPAPRKPQHLVYGPLPVLDRPVEQDLAGFARHRARPMRRLADVEPDAGLCIVKLSPTKSAL